MSLTSTRAAVPGTGSRAQGITGTVTPQYRTPPGYRCPVPTGVNVDRLVRCGDPCYGLSLLHCPDCNLHMAVPYSCKNQGLVLAHSLAEKLPEVDYRHLVITLPKKMGLRKRFQINPRLHRQIGRLIHRVLTRWTAAQIGCHRNP